MITSTGGTCHPRTTPPARRPPSAAAAVDRWSRPAISGPVAEAIAPTEPEWLKLVLTAPVSAAPALLATVRARPGPFCTVKTAYRRPGGGFDGTERDGPGRARMVATRTQGRNSADECGEDRGLVSSGGCGSFAEP